MQLGSPNLTYKCSMITHGNPFIFRSEGQIRESKQHCRGGSLHSCECWLLLVVMIICLICLFLLCLLTEDGQAELTWLTEYVQRWFSHTLCVYVCGYFYLILFRLFVRRQFWMKVYLILKTITKMLRCWNFFSHCQTSWWIEYYWSSSQKLLASYRWIYDHWQLWAVDLELGMNPGLRAWYVAWWHCGRALDLRLTGHGFSSQPIRFDVT